jgi:hypothetical protein
VTGFFRRVFGGGTEGAHRRPAEADFDTNPVAVAELMDVPDGPVGRAPASGDSATRQEFERFRAAFCFQPDRNLMDYLKAQRMTRLRNWLHWRSPEPEPKAFIRLAVAMMDRGLNIWDQAGIDMFLHGRWSQGGGCTDESYECLKMLAKVLNKPIKFFFQETNDESAGYRKVDFQP